MVRHSEGRLLLNGADKITAENERASPPLFRPGNRAAAVIAHFEFAPEFADQEPASPCPRRGVWAEQQFDFLWIERPTLICGLGFPAWYAQNEPFGLNRLERATDEFADCAVRFCAHQFDFFVRPRRLKRGSKPQCLSFAFDRIDSEPDFTGNIRVRS